jgi:hypothetical protein
VKQLQSNITEAATEIQSNVTNFRAFSQGGAFSQNVSSLDTLSDQILSGLNTFLISQAYQANGVFITRQFDTNVHELSNNGTKLNWTPCKTDYDENNVCETFWYDSVNDISYGITSNTRFHNYNSDLVTWFSNYTTPELLIQGAANCKTQPSSVIDDDNIIQLSASGLSAPCLSSMKVCTWNQTVPASPDKDIFPLFSDCTNDDVGATKLDGADCNGPPLTSKTYFQAFRSQLGWMVLDNDAWQHANIDVCASSSSASS